MAQRSVSGTIGGAHARQRRRRTGEAAAAPKPPPAATSPAAPAPAPAQPSALAMTIPTPQPTAPSTGGGLLQTSLALLFVIGLMLGLAWLTKRFGPKTWAAATATSSWSARSASARASASWWSKWANNGSWWAPRPAA
jgi:flagellar protein FliO/FliZ